MTTKHHDATKGSETNLHELITCVISSPYIITTSSHACALAPTSIITRVSHDHAVRRVSQFQVRAAHKGTAS